MRSRKPKEAKREQATQMVDLYWHGVHRAKCILHREQFVWRLIDGKAQYVSVVIVVYRWDDRQR